MFKIKKEENVAIQITDIRSTTLEEMLVVLKGRMSPYSVCYWKCSYPLKPFMSVYWLVVGSVIISCKGGQFTSMLLSEN